MTNPSKKPFIFDDLRVIEDFFPEDIAIQHICADICCQFQLDPARHEEICEWAANTLGSDDPATAFVRELLLRRIRLAFEIQNGAAH
jgi:hypothetical protein